MIRLRMALLVALLVAGLVWPAAGAWAGRTIVLDEVQIAVNDKSLTRREVATLRQLEEQELRQQLKGAELEARLRKLDEELTERLIDDLLLETYAARLSIEVSDKDIDERVDNIVRRQPNIQDLYTDEQLKTFVLKDLLRRRVLAREVDSRVRVAREDIIAACRKQSADSREVDVGHILVRGTDEAARRKLGGLREQLLGGTDFEQLAQSVSQDPSVASNKGRLGFISRGQFVKAFEDAAFALEPGSISQPVETQFGLHLIKVFGKRQRGRVDCEQLEPVARQSLENQVFASQRAERLAAFMARMRKQAEIRVNAAK